MPDDVNEVRVRLCDLQRETLAAGLQRFDESHEMPADLGGVSETGERGAFLQWMLDYVDNGPASIDRVVKAIDAAWP